MLKNIFRYGWKCYGSVLEIEKLSVEMEGPYFSDSNFTEIVEELNNAYFFSDNKVVKPAVMVNAPTGKGKTHYIINELRILAVRFGKKIIYFVNRDPLLKQVKLLLLDFDPEVRKLYEKYGCSDDWLKDYNEPIAGVLVMSYQKFYYNHAKRGEPGYIDPYEYMYLICDEAHYFLDDSKFNPTTERTLQKIIKNFNNVMRIYISASPDEVIPVIEENEIDMSRGTLSYDCCSGQLSIYYEYRVKLYYYEVPKSETNYKFMKFQYDSDSKILFSNIANIINDIGKKEKTLIFVDSKDFGKRLCKYIQDNCNEIEAAYLDSEQKNSATYNDIVKSSKFSENVLITTPVLDNGVNIKDSELNNIIVLYLDAIKYIQSVGRKRMKKGDTLTIWLPNFDAKYLYKKKTKILNFKKELEEAKKDPLDYMYKNYCSGNTSYIRCINRIGNCLEINKFAEYRNEFELSFINDIIEGYDSDPDFCIKAQLKLLGEEESYNHLGYTRFEFDLINELKKQYYFTGYQVDKQVVLDDFKALCNKILGDDPTDRPDRSEKPYTMIRANNLLERHNIPFRFIENGDFVKLTNNCTDDDTNSNEEL